MTKNYNFKCKICGNILKLNGKDYGSNFRFFTCECGIGIWIDIKTRIDQNGYKYNV